MAESGGKSIVIATGNPYDYLDYSSVNNYITNYEPALPAISAAIKVMAGDTRGRDILPVASQPMAHSIRRLTSTEADLEHVCSLWKDIFEQWPISQERLKSLISADDLHLIHKHGFCLSYVNSASRKGNIACIGVRRGHRGQGIGTALINAAKDEMRTTLDSSSTPYSPSTQLVGIGVHSVFPRFWPGVPSNLEQNYRDFFLRRGFRKSTDPIARDLYRNITADVACPKVLARVASLPLTFSPWAPDLYEETMRKQRENFSHNQPWIQAYERLAAANQHHEVLVVFDASGAQVGWTLMCSPSSVIAADFAFLPLLPAKEKTGVIACVGIDKNMRGGGVGQAMLVKAMEDMKRRGVEGVFIDWVVLKGFYESLGFEDYWQYEKYEL